MMEKFSVDITIFSSTNIVQLNCCKCKSLKVGHRQSYELNSFPAWCVEFQDLDLCKSSNQMARSQQLVTETQGWVEEKMSSQWCYWLLWGKKSFSKQSLPKHAEFSFLRDCNL
jgi:hypothetical protein